jgi:hypothetical protein
MNVVMMMMMMMVTTTMTMMTTTTTNLQLLQSPKRGSQIFTETIPYFVILRLSIS